MTTTFPTILAQESLKKYFFSSIGVSSQAGDTENLFMYILWINIISFVMLMMLLGYFIVKYRRSKQTENYQVSAAHNTPLELTWSIVPLLVMIPIFYWGFTGFADKLAAPQDAEEIIVKGQQWKWSFIYRNGAQPPDEMEMLKTGQKVPVFIVPVNRPVKLIMSSEDVIHSFYIPDFRTNMDVIPNRYTSMWFYAQELTNEIDPKTGQRPYPDKPANPAHAVFCNQYCGQDHSEMGAYMKVVPREEFEKTIVQWTDYKPELNLLKVGAMVYTRKGCNSCHTIDGSASTGPTWKNLFGDVHHYTNGETQTVSENTLREDIPYSQKRILQGFENKMPTFAGQINELELDGVILYIKSLSDKFAAQAQTAGAETVKQFRDQEKAAKEGGAAPAKP
jgi:cytochrome c oxidase subunit II